MGRNKRQNTIVKAGDGFYRINTGNKVFLLTFQQGERGEYGSVTGVEVRDLVEILLDWLGYDMDALWKAEEETGR